MEAWDFSLSTLEDTERLRHACEAFTLRLAQAQAAAEAYPLPDVITAEPPLPPPVQLHSQTPGQAGAPQVLGQQRQQKAPAPGPAPPPRLTHLYLDRYYQGLNRTSVIRFRREFGFPQKFHRTLSNHLLSNSHRPSRSIRLTRYVFPDNSLTNRQCSTANSQMPVTYSARVSRN